MGLGVDWEEDWEEELGVLWVEEVEEVGSVEVL